MGLQAIYPGRSFLVRWGKGTEEQMEIGGLRSTGAFLNHVGALCLAFWSDESDCSFGIPVNRITLMEPWEAEDDDPPSDAG